MLHIDAVLPKLQKVRQVSADQYMACCPAHPDRTPSLSIKVGAHGQALLWDFGGCDYRAIIHELQSRPGAMLPTPIHMESSPGYSRRDTAQYAQALWDRVARENHEVATHPYAIGKGIAHAFGAGRTVASGRLIGHDADVLVIPIRTEGVGEVISVQAINGAGHKQTFGPMGDAYLLLGNEHDKEGKWVVCEGWATAHAYAEAWRRAVTCVSFGKGRLEKVAHNVAAVHQPRRIVILEEEDHAQS